MRQIRYFMKNPRDSVKREAVVSYRTLPTARNSSRTERLGGVLSLVSVPTESMRREPVVGCRRKQPNRVFS